MTKRTVTISLAFLGVLLFAGSNATGQSIPLREPGEPVELVLTVQVLQIGPLPVDSSRWPFRLVRYRILAVCAGKYSGDEIVLADWSDPYVSGLRIGDQVCLKVSQMYGPAINENLSIDHDDTEERTVHHMRDVFIKDCYDCTPLTVKS